MADTKEVTNKYRVKPGRAFGTSKQHKPGDIVELTEAEASAFLDKLELVEVLGKSTRAIKPKDEAKK